MSRHVLQGIASGVATLVFTRESRPEDVARIKKLVEACQERDAAIKKLQEDSKFYKLELQNRDRNYTEVFGRTPTVGVMQVWMEKGCDSVAWEAHHSGWGRVPNSLWSDHCSLSPHRSMHTAVSAGTQNPLSLHVL
jgi:hypothetical protein